MRFLKESPSPHSPRIDAAVPSAALPGGEIEVRGTHLGPASFHVPTAIVSGVPASVLLSRPDRVIVRIPDEAQSGKLEIQQNGQSSNSVQIRVGRLIAENVHPVANPAVDANGNIFVTLSGSRGQKTPVSVFRISPDGEPEPFLTGLMNATGLAFDHDGRLYVSSRYDGTVYRVGDDGSTSVYAEGMGVATGIAFDPAGSLYVGDRSGTIFKIGPDRQIFVFATLEPSVAAYHLAFGLDGTLYVSAPTTSSYDSIFAIDRDGVVRTFYRGLGRPQGLAVDAAGNLYVSASLRGQRGIVEITPEASAELVVAGSGMVGLAFLPRGGILAATNSAIYDVPLEVEGARLYSK